MDYNMRSGSVEKDEIIEALTTGKMPNEKLNEIAF